MKMSLRRKLFYGATLAIVVALLLLPSTGWLARKQLLPWTLPASNTFTYSDRSEREQRQSGWEARYRRTLAANRDQDFNFRFAHSFATDEEAETLRRLDDLNRDYPDNPAILAAILKYNLAKAVHVSRPEQDMLTPAERKKREIYAYKDEPSDPATVAQFTAIATQGEKLEPQNALFPVMVAMGEFARKNDDAAIAAWLRAAQKPLWDGHDTEEVAARWQLDRAMNGGQEAGAISRVSSMFVVRFPQYAVLRASARMASYCAWQAELRGDTETGFVIRRASRQVGQTLQRTSKSSIGNIVGGAIIGIAISKSPGLLNLPENPYKGEGSANKWADEKRRLYAAHLLATGHADEATVYTQAASDTDNMKVVRRRASPETYVGFENKARQHIESWAAGFLLLAGVVFSLVFAGIFKLVYRFSPRLQKGEPLQASARWGVTAGLLLPAVGAAITLSAIGLWLEPDQAVLLGFVVGVATLAVPPFLLRLGGRGFAHGLGVMLATWATLAALITAGFICFAAARSITDTFGFMATGGEYEDAAWQSAVQTATPWIIGFAVLSVPLGLLTLFGVFSKILRVPFAAGVTRGMRAMAVPLAAFLTLLWAGAFLVTLRHENAAIREMEAMNRVGEVQYLRGIADALPVAKGEMK